VSNPGQPGQPWLWRYFAIFGSGGEPSQPGGGGEQPGGGGEQPSQPSQPGSGDTSPSFGGFAPIAEAVASDAQSLPSIASLTNNCQDSVSVNIHEGRVGKVLRILSSITLDVSFSNPNNANVDYRVFLLNSANITDIAGELGQFISDAIGAVII